MLLGDAWSKLASYLMRSVSANSSLSNYHVSLYAYRANDPFPLTVLWNLDLTGLLDDSGRALQHTNQVPNGPGLFVSEVFGNSTI